MSKVVPPVLGFNNNVRHRGRVFHIQTEDSGIKSPRIVTHLFADGGRIIKTRRTDYASHLGRPDLPQLVRQMMKTQHKEMFTRLRAGELDELLEAACGPLPLPAADAAASATVPVTQPLEIPAPESEVTAPALTNPNLRKVTPSVPPPSAEAIDLAVGSLEGLPVLGERDSDPASPKKVAAGGRRAGSLPIASVAERSGPASRPSSRFGSVPTKAAGGSIFGDGVLSEKSLDEVILSYLAEDLDGSSE